MASKFSSFAARAIATGAVGVMLAVGAGTASASTSPANRGDHGRQHCSYHRGYWQNVYERGSYDRRHHWQGGHWTRVWHPGYQTCDSGWRR